MLSRPPPRPVAAPAAPLKVSDSVRVLIGHATWMPGFVVCSTPDQVKVLLDVPKRSPEFSLAFDAGFDSNGIMWLDRDTKRMRRGGATRR